MLPCSPAVARRMLGYRSDTGDALDDAKTAGLNSAFAILVIGVAVLVVAGTLRPL